MAQQQLIETVVGARDEDRHALDVTSVAELPAHVEALGQPSHGGFETDPIGLQALEVEVNALEEGARLDVGVLVRVEDVGSMAVEELRKSRHQAHAIGA